MKCEEAKKILLEEQIADHLNSDLLDHLKTCKECYKYYKAENIYSMLADSAKNQIPKLNYNKITNNVLREISGKDSYKNEADLNWIERIIFHPGFRRAAAIVIIFITASFLIEEYKGIEKVYNLETQFQKLNSVNKLQIYKAESFFQVDKLMTLFTGQFGLSKGNERNIIINEADLMEVLRLFISRENIQNDEFRRFLTVLKININDGLTRDELNKISLNKNSIKEILIKNLSSGGK